MVLPVGTREGCLIRCVECGWEWESLPGYETWAVTALSAHMRQVHGQPMQVA